MQEAVASFIALAKEDLALARKLIADYPRHSAFFIEQGAEKLLKAVLTAENITFAAGHQLGRLADLLPVGHVWRADLMTFDRYTRFATVTRYPRPGGGMPDVPSKQVLEAGLKEVSSLVTEIEDWCREKFADRLRSKR